MKHKDLIGESIIAFTVSKKLYGKFKYTVSTVKIYRDAKARDCFSVRYTIACSHKKEDMIEEAKRIAQSVGVPFHQDIKNNMQVLDYFRKHVVLGDWDMTTEPVDINTSCIK